jgi:hypothetical protein
MRIIDISHRKTDSEHTSPSPGVQGACCQVSINSAYSQQSNNNVNRQLRCARQSFTSNAIGRAQTRPRRSSALNRAIVWFHLGLSLSATAHTNRAAGEWAFVITLVAVGRQTHGRAVVIRSTIGTAAIHRH